MSTESKDLHDLVRPGKSEGADQVPRSLLGDVKKCVKAAAAALEAGRSVVIDNTNPDVEARAVWIELAKEHSATARCLHLTSPERLCKHNNWLRIVGQTDPDNVSTASEVGRERRTLLPDIAFASYSKRFQPPSMAEGFATVDEVPFVVDDKVNARWRHYYS